MASYLQSRLSKKESSRHFDVDVWYETLKAVTFETIFIPVSPELAEAMIRFYRIRYNRFDVTTINTSDLALLKRFEGELHSAICQYGDSGAFVRLSQRSPKDGEPEDFEGLKSALTAVDNNDEDGNALLAHMFAITSQILRVTSGSAAMSLLTSSERVFCDMLLALDAYQATKETVWDTFAAVRRWNPLLRDDREFRCFVSSGQITAISQYNPYCVYDWLQGEEQQTKVKMKIQQYWKETVDPLMLEFARDYVVDIGILDDDNSNLVVIELNPLDQSTGAGLFDWKIDEKLLILKEEEDEKEKEEKEEEKEEKEEKVENDATHHHQQQHNKQVHIRVRSAPLENALDMAHVLLRERLETSRSNVGDYNTLMNTLQPSFFSKVKSFFYSSTSTSKSSENGSQN